MFELRQSAMFEAWFAALRDTEAKRKIAAQLVRVASGLFGDAKPVGEGVSELRIHHGPGYRVYFSIRGKELVILLCDGDKSSQDRDIKTAKRMASDF